MKLLHLHIERSNEDLRRAMEQQYQYMYDITVASRSRIIRIKGIPEDESPEHTLEEMILELFDFMGVMTDIKDIERANRVGKRKENGVPPRLLIYFVIVANCSIQDCKCGITFSSFEIINFTKITKTTKF